MAELTKEETKDYLAHFPKLISEELDDYVTNEVFLKSRYIFTNREGKQQYGYCTHCNDEFKTRGLKHNEKTFCPECNSICTVKSSGRGRSKMVDRAYFVYYEKSEVDTKTIVARGIEACRNYNGDYHTVETEYRVKTWYIFDSENKKGGIMFGEPSWYGAWIHNKTNYEQYKSVYSYFSKYNGKKMTYVGVSRDSIKEAVKGTSFSWSGWEKYDHDDMTKFFDLYTKYPCIEYLTKLEFTKLVRDKLEGAPTYSAINWRGKNLFSVLKIEKQQLQEIKQNNIYVNYLFLHLLQRSKKLNWNLNLEEIQYLERIASYYLKELDDVFVHAPAKKAITYFKKQSQKLGKHFSYTGSVFSIYKDYIRDCKRLQMDLTKENVLFPRNLYTAHQNTIKQVKYKEDKALSLKIEERLKDLSSKYTFTSEGLIIRPAISTKELIEEGKALNHCVGGYAERYAKGETIILVIRKVEEINKSYYTVEIKNNTIVQVRGKSNCNTTVEVEKFIKTFKESKLAKKSSKIKEKVAIPA